MTTLLSLATHGIDAPDTALALVRIGTGVFFACSGWNKLTSPVRHDSFVETLRNDHVPFLRFNQWWVPTWELVAGCALAFGLFTAFSASVLLIICAVACFAEASRRVEEYAPINKVDVVADYLYLPEVLYMLLLCVNILAGTGEFSLDHILFERQV